MKKLYLCAMLAFAMGAFALEKTLDQIPPNCTLIPATGATATSGDAALAIDNNGGTRWESAFNDAESLTIDMGTAVNINTVTIDWEAANAKDYVLRGSVNGTDWTAIETLTNMPTGARTDVIDGINASYRYIKMDGVLRNLPYGYSIWEIYVCADEIVIPDCTAAVITTATATSGNAALAIDDVLGSRWESDATDPQTLTVDLGEAALISEISIIWETANAKDYTLSGSLNGTDWTVIETLTDMPAGPRVDSFDDVDAEYRYVQMHGTARNTPWGYSIYEFDVCLANETGPVDPEPFECESPVVAESATATTGNAALAIDGVAGSRWESDAADPQTLTVDLGALYDVGAVTIDWEAANAKDYTLSGSVDGIAWTVIETLTDMPTGERTDEILEIDAEYRYLKMEGTARNTQYGYSIWEFNVCGEPVVIVEPFECDSPLEADSATASTGNAAAAVDGNTGTRWESDAADPQTLTVDMGEVVTVEAITIFWETANAKDYTLSGSVDGTTWVTIETLTDMPTGQRTDEILEINTDYRWLKVEGTARNTPYGYSIWEFTVCGEAPEEEIEYVDVPAVLEAENWYDMQGVETEATGDTGGGLSVGWIDTGDWMDYAIDVEDADTYTINARVASNAEGGVIGYAIDGSSIGTINVPNTGGWQVWQTVSIDVALPEGEHMLRVSAVSAPFNLNWVEVAEVTGSESFEAAGIAMYPNPANSQVNITLNNDAQLSLYTYTGTLVMQQDIKAGSNTISLNGLATGLYFVKVNNSVAKLIVR